MGFVFGDTPDAWGDDTSWTPTDKDKGAEIEGDVVKVEEAFSKKFENSFKVLTLRVDGGDEIRVPCARAHLASLVEQHEVAEGDRVGIKFFGRAGEGEPYLYAMQVRKASEAPF